MRCSSGAGHGEGTRCASRDGSSGDMARQQPYAEGHRWWNRLTAERCRSSLGGAEAVQLRYRRARLSAVRGAPCADRDRGGSGGGRTDLAPPGVAGDGLRARSPSVAPVVPGVVNRPVARSATGHHAPCPSRAPRVNPPEVRPAHRSACLVVRRGTRSRLTIASRADIVGRIRSHGAAGRRESARGQSVIRRALMQTASFVRLCIIYTGLYKYGGVFLIRTV